MIPVDLAGMRRLNSDLTLRALRDSGQATLAKLAARTGLSRRTTELILDSLEADGYARRAEEPTTGNLGRPARSYAFVPDARLVAGIRISPEAVEVDIADLHGDVIGSCTIPTEFELGRDDRVATAIRCFQETVAAAGVDAARIRHVTVATVGPVRDDGMVDLHRSIPDWSGFSLSEALSVPLGCPVTVENDVKLAALGERWKGVASGVDDLIWIWSSGHRSGAGIVINGRVHRGLHGLAGELRWAPQLGFDLLQSTVFESTVTPTEDKNRKVTTFLESARAGDAETLAEIDRLVELLTPGIEALTWTLAPRLVVLGPDLSIAADLLAPRLIERLRQNSEVVPEIRGSSLGAAAILAGALRVALDHIEAELLGPRPGDALIRSS